MPTVSFNTNFPGYEVIGELGRSNARVLKARRLATGEIVAIKHFALNTDPETLRRFRLESELMTGIQHPNVVRVNEVQIDRPLPYMVMDWIEGGNLRSLFAERGPLDVPTTIRLGLQMAGAFRAIHPQGIVHRDIKPENILYRPLPSGELHFLLTDFGVARLREQTQTMTGQSLLTYEYASPEQFDNPKHVDAATDYYSLGVVLYECLTGRVPFSMANADGMASFMSQVLEAPVPPLPLEAGQSVPPSIQALINWTLTKDPAQRLSDVDELSVLLGQASVEQLQAGRSADRTAPEPSRTKTAPHRALQPAETPVAASDAAPTHASTWWGLGGGLMGVGVLVGLTVFYQHQQKTTPFGAAPDSTVRAPDSSAANAITTDTTPAQPASITDLPAADSGRTDERPPERADPGLATDSTKQPEPTPVVIDSTDADDQ